MKTRFLFFSLLATTSILSQKKYLTERPVYIDVIKQYIYVTSKKDSSIRTDYGDQSTKYIKVFDLTTKGGMKFILVDTLANIILSGQYKDALKLSKPKGFTRVGARVGTKKGGIAQYYYNPLRDGKWYYRYSNGKIQKIEIYRRGILIKK